MRLLPDSLGEFGDGFGEGGGSAKAFGLGVAVRVAEFALDSVDNAAAGRAVLASGIAAIEVGRGTRRQVVRTRDTFQAVLVEEGAEGFPASKQFREREAGFVGPGQIGDAG